MSHAVWQTLLDEARRAHCAHAGLTSFCPFPDDIIPQVVTPHHVPAANLFVAEDAVPHSDYAALSDALRAAAPVATWRETYKDTNIGQDFLDRFACYCLIGSGGAFQSDRINAWMVYMPAGLHYPWHHHPAEEAYLVLAGSALFFRRDQPSEVLGPGDLMEHQSNQPHAMETTWSPVLAYVVWRNRFGIAPVLTEDEAPA